MSRFGFGISGLYKSELVLFCGFGCLYRERYFCSYSLISFCFALRFALKCGLRVSLPRAISCCVQDVDFFMVDFGSLYRERYFCSYSLLSFFMFRFGVGFSGLYKLELAFFFNFVKKIHNFTSKILKHIIVLNNGKYLRMEKL